jgi:hypothetical protein
MPSAQVPDKGVVLFVPKNVLDRENGTDLLRELLAGDPPEPEGTGGWPRVRDAIRRCGRFIVEAETPCFTATLRFHPDQPKEGHYEIHHRPRGGVDTGRTFKVEAVAADDTRHVHSRLKKFDTRYAVSTVGWFAAGSARRYGELIRFVGLRSFRLVDEANVEDGPVGPE